MSLVGSLASIVRLATGEKPVQASLAVLDQDGIEIDEKKFQYFPETISLSKDVNYATKAIPGGSHPIYQWINCGDRNISFQAVLTAEENNENQSILEPGGLNIGTIIKKITTSSSKKPPETKYTIDIKPTIMWFESLLVPDYQGGMAKAPPVLRLYLPNSGILGTSGGGVIKDSVNCILNNLSITYEAFHRNGAPRIVTLDMSFNETLQVGNRWKYLSRQSILDDLQGKNSQASINGQLSQLANKGIPSVVSKFLKI